MRLRCSHLLTATLGVLAGACAGGPQASEPEPYERCLVLPADVAAAIGAGALRRVLPFADPLPAAAGAPASVLPDGTFEVRFEQGADQAWLPCGSHRLRVQSPSDAKNGTAVQHETLRGNLRLSALGRRAVAHVQLHITTTGEGCRIVGTLPDVMATTLRSALDQAFALAEDPISAELGLTEANLAAWASHRLLAEAAAEQKAGHAEAAHALLMRVLRLGTCSASMQASLGEYAATAGDHVQACERLLDAMVTAHDPTLRAHLAQRLNTIRNDLGNRVAMQRAVRKHLADRDFTTAATLLHTASRHQRDPVEDYQLASQVHGCNDHAMHALACSLLAREHDIATQSLAGFAPTRTPDYAMRSLLDLSRRLARGVQPAVAFAPGQPWQLSPAAAAPLR